MKILQRFWLDLALFCAWLLALTALAAPAWPQQAPPQDLTKSSLEDLMNIEVTSVSKKEEKLSRTAAAVFVITQEDIRHSGATNIPDVLRMVPGVDVAQINANKWAVSIRGLNGLYSNELLVLVDGRSVYTQTSGGVFWDVLDLPLEDIDRIEVIRGPGGAVWGANAVNGVINIISKKASTTHGAMVVAGGGSLTPEFGTLQYGAGIGQSTDYRVFAKYFNQDQSPGLSGKNGADGWHTLRGGFRADSSVSARDRLTVQGDIYTGREGITDSVLASVTARAAQPANAEVNLSGGYVQSVWDHSFSARSETSLQFTYDRYDRDNALDETRGTFDLTFQHHIAIRARHDVVWGLEARTSGLHSDGSLFVSLQPADIRTELFGGFIQDEIALAVDRVHITLGTKLERNPYSGFNMMPTARLAWTPTQRQTLWTAVSRAVHTPADTDNSIRLNFAGVPGPGGTPALISLLGSTDFKDENLVAVEAGYRTAVTARISIDLAAYYNDYTSQQTDEPAAAFFETTPAPSHFVFPTTYGNLMNGEAHGLEVFANWRLLDRWTLSPGYAFEQVRMHLDPGSRDTSSVGEADGSAPVNSAQIRSHIALPRRFSWDASAYFVGRIADPVVPSYTRVDTSLSWQVLERLSFSVVGQNLLRDSHLEYVDTHRSVASTLMKRSVYAKFTWTF
jgi:iron complex outermembrane receptor protein